MVELGRRLGRSRWRTLAVALALCMAAAACGNGGDGTDVTDDTTDDAEETEEAAGSEESESTDEPESTDEAEGSKETVELTFWTFVDRHAEFLQERAEEFNEQSDKYNIEIDASVAEFAPHHDRLLIALQSGTGAPDLVDIEISKFGTFTRGEVQLHELTDVIDPHRENLVEERLAPYMVDGVAYGIDYHLGSFVMYYNNEIMEAAGVDVDSIETWDDYIEAGKQVVENTDAWMTTIETQDRWSLYGPMLQNGGGIYDAEGNFIFDSPENVEAVELIASMVHEHEIATTPPGGGHHDPAYFEAFNNGEFASVWMPQWYMTRFKDHMPDTEGKMLVRPLPAFEPGGAVSTMGGGTGTAITAQIDEDKLEAAKEFLAFAKLTYEANIHIWTDLGFDPLRSDVYDDEALGEPDPWFSNEPVMANLKEMFDALTPEYTGPRYPEAVQTINDTIAFNVVQEGADPAEELKRAADEVRALD